MSVSDPPRVQSVYPALFYRQAPAAIAWLKDVLGFEEKLVVPGPDGTVAHAELRFRGAVVMVSTAQKERAWSSPLELQGVSQLIYLVVTDPDQLHERLVAAGVEIAIPLQDMEYGSREFTARDPEGHFWSFGTYQPSG